MNIADKLKEKYKSIYVIVAEKVGVTPRFVGQIARGERKGLRGKGLEVKKELESLIK
jgi:hypothetical protein